MRQWNPIANTPMHSRHLEMGATMTIRDGWLRASRYSTVDHEFDAIQRHLGIADISHRGKLRIQGMGIAERFKDLGIRMPEAGHVSRLPLKTGEAQTVVSIARLARDEAALTTGTGQAARIIETITQATEGCLHVIDVSSALACVRLVGPDASKALAAISEVDVDNHSFPNLRCIQGRFADVQSLVIRVDSGHIPSYGLYYAREFGQHVWDTLLDASRPLGAEPVGFEALLRMGSGSA